jgi:hypothetical protein
LTDFIGIVNRSVGVFGIINAIKLRYRVVSFIVLVALENFQSFLNLFFNFQRFPVLFSALY